MVTFTEIAGRAREMQLAPRSITHKGSGTSPKLNGLARPARDG
jgi:hypothetical protein